MTLKITDSQYGRLSWRQLASCTFLDYNLPTRRLSRDNFPLRLHSWRYWAFVFIRILNLCVCRRQLSIKTFTI